MSTVSEIESEIDADYDSDTEQVGLGLGLDQTLGSDENMPEDDSDDELEFESDDEEVADIQDDAEPQEGAIDEKDSESENELGLNYDSDDAVQDAFNKGLLKPGLNAVFEKNTKVHHNNVAGLKRRLAEIRLHLPWVERLDLVNGLAPLAPELALKLEETQQKREVFIRNFNANKKQLTKLSQDDDPVLNEFRREMNFHRQAQAAVLLGVPKLIAAGVLSKRPTDYFAQMAKSDEHMQKVRTVLMKKRVAAERSEKAKKQRQTKKLARSTQIASKLKKVNEKREMLEEVKKYRKGIRKDLDFLDDKKKAPPKKAAPYGNNRSVQKRNFKDKKFGYGGKKSGMKRNTKASSAGMDESRGKHGKAGKGGKPGRGGKQGRAGKSQPRPGKSKRQKAKSGSKR